eukprot:6137915-Karenia_brevis.AAC.1
MRTSNEKRSQLLIICLATFLKEQPFIADVTFATVTCMSFRVMRLSCRFALWVSHANQGAV